MKLNIAYPPTGAQKCIEIDDEKKLRAFYDKRMSQEVDGVEALGEQYKGYVFKITGGNDKQGFPMKQGVLTNTRVRLLLRANTTCYKPRRDGERRRKSVRGCIVGSDISVLHLVVVKKGEEEVEGLTDKYIPRRLGPKRASKIRKLFALGKDDDVRKYVIKREIAPKEGKGKEGKTKTKAPKIQRLVTPQVLQRRRHERSIVKRRHDKNRREAADYAKMLAQRRAALQVKRSQIRSKRAERLSAAKGTSVGTPSGASTASAAKPPKGTSAANTTATSSSAPKAQKPKNPKPTTAASKK